MKSNDQITYFGDKTYLVIQTSSMASINDNNKYLKDGSIDSKDKMNTRISQYAFIGIDKFKSEDQIKVYDIVAFRMDDKIIVHRVYSISIGEKMDINCSPLEEMQTQPLCRVKLMSHRIE